MPCSVNSTKPITYIIKPPGIPRQPDPYMKNIPENQTLVKLGHLKYVIDQLNELAGAIPIVEDPEDAMLPECCTYGVLYIYNDEVFFKKCDGSIVTVGKCCGTVIEVEGINSIDTTPDTITETGTIQLVNDELNPGELEYYGTDNTGTKGFFPLPVGSVISVEGINSIDTDPDIITGTGTVQLVNDELDPGPSEYYGTDSLSTKGFFPLPAAVAITGVNSVDTTPNTITGTGTVQLVNDELAPGNEEYYGTNSSGVKGFFPVPMLLIGNTLVVSKLGSDATGARNNWDKHYLSVTAAITAAQSGDTVYVFPGTFTITTSIQKDGVTVHLFDGAIIQATSGSVINITTNITFSVDGNGVLTSTGNNHCVIQNSAGSILSIRCKKILTTVTNGVAANILSGTLLRMDVSQETSCTPNGQYAMTIRGSIDAIVNCPLFTDDCVNDIDRTVNATTVTLTNLNADAKVYVNTTRIQGRTSGKTLNLSNIASGAKVFVNYDQCVNDWASGSGYQAAVFLDANCYGFIKGDIYCPGTANGIISLDLVGDKTQDVSYSGRIFCAEGLPVSIGGVGNTLRIKNSSIEANYETLVWIQNDAGAFGIGGNLYIYDSELKNNQLTGETFGGGAIKIDIAGGAVTVQDLAVTIGSDEVQCLLFDASSSSDPVDVIATKITTTWLLTDNVNFHIASIEALYIPPYIAP